VTTSDSSSTEEVVEIRPIAPSDKAALQAAIEQSSGEAIYRRFLNPHGRLTAAELRYFTEVDHRNHEALTAIDPISGNSVGVARYVRDRDRPESAEIAVSVLETWQGRGVGKVLIRHLAERARSEGVTRFTALMLGNNWAMQHVLAELGELVVVETSSGTVEFAVDLHVPR
jgi:GNAT superfamily N-acetyltransferase